MLVRFRLYAPQSIWLLLFHFRQPRLENSKIESSLLNLQRIYVHMKIDLL